MSTIHDVARLAGVSKTTVSKILGGSKNVRPSTLARVNAAIRELDYVPNCFAQGMRRTGTKTIAVLLPEQYNYGYMEMLAGIEECANKNGYMTFVCSTGRNGEYEDRYLKEAVRRKADAILYFAYRRQGKSLEYLQHVSAKTAVVVMDNVLLGEKLDVVRVDGFSLTKRMVRQLMKSGRKRIAYIRGPKECDATAERCSGYAAGLAGCGLAFDEALVVEAEFTMEGGHEAARALMAEKPDAIMATTDMLALGALDYLKGAGIRVPGEVAVVGFDDIPLCVWSRPRLTTISQNQRKVGEEAVRRALARIAEPDKEAGESLLAGEPVWRETT